MDPYVQLASSSRRNKRSNTSKQAEVKQEQPIDCPHLEPDRVQTLIGATTELTQDDLQFTLPFTERRRGVEMKFAIEDSATVDKTLLRNIANANHWYRRIKEGATFYEIETETGTSKRRIQQMISLAFLAPDIVRQIAQGQQPVGLTSDWLLRQSIPANWEAQRERVAYL